MKLLKKNVHSFKNASQLFHSYNAAVVKVSPTLLA